MSVSPEPSTAERHSSSETTKPPPADTGSGRPRAGAGIKLHGLSKTFAPDVVALQDIDLEIRGGEFFTLLGPSGCGKTTLLRIIAGLEDTTDGEVEIGGKRVTDIRPHRRNVNTVFQSYALFPHLNVRDNIGFGLRMRGVAKDEIKHRIGQTAAFIKIDNLLDRRIEQLSGGQRQRIALARALINEPDVLLLDEPLSALDAGLRGELQVELLRIQRRLGMTFVFVTHDQQEAMVMSDRIAVLNDGRVQQIGTPADLYEHPTSAFVARFMGHSNLYPIREQTESGLATDFAWFTGDFQPGSHVLLRPGTLSVEAGDNPGDNRFVGRVNERLYRGSVAEYTLACGDNEVVATCNNIGEPMFEEGTTVTVGVHTGGVVTLDE